MKKKFGLLTVILLIAMMIISLTGCGKSSDEDETEELSATATNYLNVLDFVDEKLEVVPDIESKMTADERKTAFRELTSKIKDGTVSEDEDFLNEVGEILWELGCNNAGIATNDYDSYSKEEYLPFELEHMEEGLILRSGTDTVSKYLGDLIDSINGYSIKDFAELYIKELGYSSTGSKEDDVAFRSFSKKELVKIGVCDEEDKGVEVVVTDLSGNKQSFTANFYVAANQSSWNDLSSKMASKDLPLSERLKYTNDVNAYRYFADLERKTMYFQYLYTEDSSIDPLEKYFGKVIAEMKEADSAYTNFVIDISTLGGDNRKLFQGILEEYADYLNTKNVYIVIGVFTNSAGIQNLEDCLTYLKKAKIYGCSTFSAVNAYTDVKEFKIPDSKWSLYLPTMKEEFDNLSKRSKNSDEFIKPDVEVRQSIKDYMNGIDTVYEKILSNN